MSSAGKKGGQPTAAPNANLNRRQLRPLHALPSSERARPVTEGWRLAACLRYELGPVLARGSDHNRNEPQTVITASSGHKLIDSGNHLALSSLSEPFNERSRLVFLCLIG